MPIKYQYNNRLSFNCYQQIFLCLILITKVSCQINCQTYKSSTINTCTICLNTNSFDSCLKNNVSLTLQNCVSQCCTNQFKSTSSYFCLNNKSTKQNDSSSSSNRLAIILTVIFFSVPITVCACAFLINCLKKQAQPRREQTPPISAINLRNFDIDDLGPYYLETTQVCSICLEQKCFIRTKCGHIYHPDCLEAWIRKKETCPFCVSQDINPIKIYCSICLRSVKLSVFSMHMEEQLQRQWQQVAEIKCQTCQGKINNSQKQISLQQSQNIEGKNEQNDEKLRESVAQINRIQQNQKSEILHL